ncbi:MAG: glycosyltransferase family 8 protein [Clostridia bacterium]|nr:glycosyltransferase family 8 protein [Clostridia bacterium]
MKLKAKSMIWASIIIVVALLAGFWWVFWEKSPKADKIESIPIAMALDDEYTYPTIVAITSVMENKNPETKYDFYIMHPSEFREENKEKLRSLSSKYEGCAINLIDMADKYVSANQSGFITTPAYYRLALSDTLPDIDKIIWLDSDTLTFTDLTGMYNINMRSRYYDGFLDYPGQDEFAPMNDHYICSGVMLVNLKSLRNDGVTAKFDKFIERNNDKLAKHDQTIINAICGVKNGVLPAKYGIFNSFRTTEAAKAYHDILNAKNKYSREELAEAFEHPAVLHVTYKPWKSSEEYAGDKWWSYAEKTNFYDEIRQKYSMAFEKQDDEESEIELGEVEE